MIKKQVSGSHHWTTAPRERSESVMLLEALNCIEYRFAAAPKING